MTLATIDDVADYVGRELTIIEARLAGSLIGPAQARVEQYAQHRIEIVMNDVVTVADVWGRELWLPEWPVSAVSSVALDGTALVANTGYRWDTLGRLWRPYGTFIDDTYTAPFPVGYWGRPPDSRVVVTYTHGYAVDTPVYNVARQAVIELVALRVQLTSPNLKRSISIDDLTVTYASATERGIAGDDWLTPLKPLREAAQARAQLAA